MTAPTRIGDLNTRFLEQAIQAQRDGFELPSADIVSRASRFIATLAVHELMLKADSGVHVGADGAVEFVVVRGNRIATVFIEPEEAGYELVVRDRDTGEVTEHTAPSAELAVDFVSDGIIGSLSPEACCTGASSREAGTTSLIDRFPTSSGSALPGARPVCHASSRYDAQRMTC